MLIRPRTQPRHPPVFVHRVKLVRQESLQSFLSNQIAGQVWREKLKRVKLRHDRLYDQH